MNIKLFYDNVDFRLRESKKIRKLIERVIRNEGKDSDDLLFIFTDDNKLLEINREFLNHNWFTDVVAFDYSKGKNIIGEIYISIDTVRYNADNYKVSLNSEIIRVMIHGILHLCGYEDHKKEMRNVMSKKEDKWIEEYGKL